MLLRNATFCREKNESLLAGFQQNLQRGEPHRDLMWDVQERQYNGQKSWAGLEMAQWVMASASKPDNLSFTTKTHREEGETELHLHPGACVPPTHTNA